MTTLIKLTITDRVPMSKNFQGKEIYVNASKIVVFYKAPNLNCTVIKFSSQDKDEAILVDETPEEIENIIWRAEHPVCKL